MINHNSPNSQMPICNALRRHTIGIGFAILAWCPAGRAQTNNPAPASAEEVKQLRGVVESLLTRVTELEKELKERHPAAAATTERNSGDSNATRADAGATVEATPTTVSAQSAAVEASKERVIAADRGILDYLHGATLNFALDEYYGFTELLAGERHEPGGSNQRL